MVRNARSSDRSWQLGNGAGTRAGGSGARGNAVGPHARGGPRHQRGAPQPALPLGLPPSFRHPRHRRVRGCLRRRRGRGHRDALGRSALGGPPTCESSSRLATPIVICSKGVEEKTAFCLSIPSPLSWGARAACGAVRAPPMRGGHLPQGRRRPWWLGRRRDGALLPRSVRHAVLPHLHLRRPGGRGAVRRFQKRHCHCRGHLLRHGLRRQHRGHAHHPPGSPR